MELRTMPAIELEHWYAAELTEAFPPHERKPLAEIRGLIAAGRYEIVGLYDGPALVGYANLLWDPDWPGYVLLDYLGVTAGRRNQGLGGVLLRHLARRYAGKALVIAEAEAPDPASGPDDLRRHRLGFYFRNGFAVAYDSAACGQRLKTLVLGPMPEDLGALAKAHKAIYGPLRTDVIAPLEPGQTPPPPYWM